MAVAGLSVAGIDVGNDSSCVALARKRGIDVIMNGESKRETPAVVSFGDKMRYIGTEGAGKQTTNVKNTVSQIKRFIGKRFADPQVQKDIQVVPFKVTESPNGGCLINVMYCNEMTAFAPEQIMAMLLVDLKKIAENEHGSPIVDCVLSVPVYYTEAERYAMLNAASIAGLNVLRLMNENTATALAYGIYKTDLPEDKPVHVAFVDLGHSSLQVSVVAFKKGQLEVKSHAWDRSLGGRDFDEALFDHVCQEIKEKYKLDVKSNAKASFRLRVACEKVKKTLSANSEAPLNVECLMEDTDIKTMITRDQLESLSAGVLARVAAPCQKAVEMAGLKMADLSSIEVVGSCSRVQAVGSILRDVFGQEPSRTLNAKECVSRGCALQCAMLSPLFKVRDFDVKDLFPYSVEFSWEKDGQMTSQVLFPLKNAVPSTKVLTLKKDKPFDITAQYTQDCDLPEHTNRQLATFRIANFKIPPYEEKATLKVKIRLNLHSLVGIESVQAVEEEEYEEVVQKPAAAAAAAPAQPAAAAADGVERRATEDGNVQETADSQDAAGETPMEADAAPAGTDGTDTPMEGTEASVGPQPPAPATEVIKKKRVRKVDVPVQTAVATALTSKDVNDLFEREGQMAAADKLQEETNEARNALEAYVLSLRSKLSDHLADFVKEDDRVELSKQCDDIEDWLYGDGEDETKSVYVQKLAEISASGDPIESRYQESQTRDSAAAKLKSLCESYLEFAATTKPEFAHIDENERTTMRNECEAALQWLQDKSGMQAQLRKHENPVLITKDIEKKYETVDRVCRPIMTKPAPKVEPPAPAASPAADAAQPAGNDAMDTDAAPQSDETPMES